MKRFIPAIGACLMASPALAHHVMAGAPMTSFTHGLLSGIGHPVLGFDHLFFVITVGVAAVFTGRANLAPMGYLLGMLGGCLLILAGVTLPLAEFVIAASLIVLGAVVFRGRAIPLGGAMALFAGFGLFHGWAFGQTIIGQEGGMGTQVVIGYLIGLVCVQYAIARLAGLVVTHLWKNTDPQAIRPRLVGAMAAGAGALLVLEFAEGVVMSAMGLGGIS